MVNTRRVLRTQSTIHDGALLAKKVNDFQSLTIFAKSSILDLRISSNANLGELFKGSF